MVCHATKTVDAASEFLDNVLHEEVKTIPVAFVEKDRLSSITAEYHVVDCAWVMDAWFTCHGCIIHENSKKASLTL